MVRKYLCRYSGRGAAAYAELTGRIKELDERYARPLPELEQEVDVFSAKVEGHLKKMGIVL